MTQWYVKELAKLTDVSVQTLHHYDRIGLLKPSVRLPNGYRLYSENDLLKLQQIIALKFFGFELSLIKTLLTNKVDMIDHFAIQSQFLEEKAQTLLNASNTLRNIISECDKDKSIPWKTIIKLIEVFRMTQQLENKWLANVLSPDELKAYANFEKNLKNRYTSYSKEVWEKSWFGLVNDINLNLKEDPENEIGMAIGKRCMDLVNELYGKEHVSIRKIVWEKGFKSGQFEDGHGLSPQAVDWLDRAMKAYYFTQIYRILNQVGSQPQEKVLKEWNDLLIELYGDESKLKLELIEPLLNDERVNQAAKAWLRKINHL